MMIAGTNSSPSAEGDGKSYDFVKFKFQWVEKKEFIQSCLFSPSRQRIASDVRNWPNPLFSPPWLVEKADTTNPSFFSFPPLMLMVENSLLLLYTAWPIMKRREYLVA
jgi:hypothetical protein